MSTKRVISLCIAAGFILACGIIEASDGDLQQYNRPAANAEAANAANALTSALLLPTDGKLISADSNSAGKAPVNRSLKQLADAISGVRCMFTGECGSVNQRTAKSLQVDGTGGQTASAPSGTIQVSGTASGTSAPTTSVAGGVIYRDAVPLCWARGYWDGAAMVLQRGYNVRPLVRNSQGDYTITCNSTSASPTTAMAQVTLGPNPSVVAHGFVGNVLQITNDGSSRVAVEINTIDPNGGTLLDTSAISPFYVLVMAN